MSTTIDEKIVSMKFDNSNFEKNVNTSMSTLDKLKAKLNFKGASDSLDDLSKASDKLNFKETQNGLEKVSVEFNAMYAIATRVFERLTDQAIGLVKSMSVDQLASGWGKYADKTASVQTIMAATGESIETVNAQLENLAWFTDETSYNFTDMVDNIGKFTANGIKLETAVTAMEGIANWAAISGQNAAAASRAMYNLAQSMGAGYVTLMDWKSIELANMGTKSFKDLALETAEALGVLVKKGEDAEGVMQYLVAGTDKSVNYKNFRETLSDKWLTNDVLMSVLNEYGAYSQAVQMVMDRLKIDTASQTMQYIEQKFSKNGYKNDENGLNEIAETFHLTNEEAKALYDTYNSIGKAAFKAAQEAKTFEEALGATKDAVSSLWMQIFETIFGDYQEAKILFTDLANEMWNVFAGPLDALNDELGSAFNHKTDWYDFLDILEEGGYSAEKFEEALINASGKITYPYKDAEYTLSELISTFGSLEKVSENGYISFELMYDAMSSMGGAAGILANNMDKVFAITEKGGRIKLIESIAKTYNYLKDVLSAIGNAWSTVFPFSISERITKFIDKFYDFANSLELTKEQAESISSTFERVFGVFRSAGTILGTIIGSIYSIAKSILPYIAGALLEIGSYIGPFIEKIVKGIEDAITYLRENISGWIDIIANSKTVQTVMGYLNQIRTFFANTISDLGSKASNMDAKKIFGFFDSLLSLGAEFAGSVLSSPAFKKIGETVSGFISSISDSIKNFRLPSFKEISDAFSGFFSKNANSASVMKSMSKESISGFIEVIQTLFSTKVKKEKTNIVNTIVNTYEDEGSVFNKAIKWASGLIKTIAEFVSHTVGISVRNIYIATKNILSLATMFGAFKVMLSFSGLMDALRDKIKGETSSGPGGVLSALATVIRNIGIVVAEMVGLAVLLGELKSKNPKAIEQGLEDLSMILTALGGLIVAAIIAASIPGASEEKYKGIAFTILALSFAFGAIADALKKIEDISFNAEGLISFGLILGAMFLFVKGLSEIKGGVAAALPIVALASGLNMLLDTIVKYNNFNWSENLKGILTLLPMLGLVIIAINSLSGTSGINAMVFVGLTLSLKMLVGVIEDLGSIPRDELGRGIAAMVGVLTVVWLFSDIMSNLSSVSFGGKGVNVKISTFIGIMALLAALCIAVAVLGKQPVNELIAGVGAVAILMGSITALMYTLGNLGKIKITKIIPALLSVGLIMAAVGALYKYILADAKYDNAGTALLTLAGLLIEVTVFAAAADILGKTVNPVTLANGMTAIGEVLIFLGVVVGFIDFVLIELSKTLNEESLQKVARIASDLGGIIGSFFGGIAGGLAGGAAYMASTFLPYIGEQLTSFATEIAGFTKFLDDISDDKSTKMSTFMDSLGELLAGLNEISKYKGKLDNIPAVGSQLQAFMKNLTAEGRFFNGLNGVTEQHVNAAKSIAEIMNAIAPLSKTRGLESLWSGSTDFASLATNLTEFGSSVCTFVAIIQDGGYEGSRPLPPDAKETVDYFTGVASSVINLFKTIPSDGGKVDSFVHGTGKWTTITSGLNSFAVAIGGFASTVGMHHYTPKEITSMETFWPIANSVIEEFKTLPDQGGAVEAWSGSKRWSDVTAGLKEFTEAIGGLVTFASSMGQSQSYINALEKIKEMLNLALIIQQTNSEQNGVVNTMLQDMVNGYIKTISSSIALYGINLRNSGVFIGNYIKNGFEQSVTSDINSITSKFVESFDRSFYLRSKTLKEVGAGVMSSMASGIIDSTLIVARSVDAVGSSAVASLTKGIDGNASLYTRFYNLGQRAAEGLADGLNSWYAKSTVRDAAAALADTAYYSSSGALKINSPSKRFMSLGKSSVEGYTLGITNSLGSVSKATTEMGNRSIAGMNSAISRIGDAISTDSFQNQPVIRPVLDLSDVNSGADQMRGILGDNYNLALSGSVTSRRLSNSIEIQNRGSAMADAIASLKDDFRSMTDEIMGMRIVMDSGALVGSVAPKMDKALGTISTYKGRGNTY